MVNSLIVRLNEATGKNWAENPTEKGWMEIVEDIYNDSYEVYQWASGGFIPCRGCLKNQKVYFHFMREILTFLKLTHDRKKTVTYLRIIRLAGCKLLREIRKVGCMS